MISLYLDCSIIYCEDIPWSYVDAYKPGSYVIFLLLFGDSGPTTGELFPLFAALGCNGNV